MKTLFAMALAIMVGLSFVSGTVEAGNSKPDKPVACKCQPSQHGNNGNAHHATKKNNDKCAKGPASGRQNGGRGNRTNKH